VGSGMVRSDCGLSGMVRNHSGPGFSSDAIKIIIVRWLTGLTHS